MTQKKKDGKYEHFLFGSEDIEVEVRIRHDILGGIYYVSIFEAISQAESYFKHDQSRYR